MKPTLDGNKFAAQLQKRLFLLDTNDKPTQDAVDKVAAAALFYVMDLDDPMTPTSKEHWLNELKSAVNELIALKKSGRNEQKD